MPCDQNTNKKNGRSETHVGDSLKHTLWRQGILFVLLHFVSLSRNLWICCQRTCCFKQSSKWIEFLFIGIYFIISDSAVVNDERNAYGKICKQSYQVLCCIVKLSTVNQFLHISMSVCLYLLSIVLHDFLPKKCQYFLVEWVWIFFSRMYCWLINSVKLNRCIVVWRQACSSRCIDTQYRKSLVCSGNDQRT